MLERAFAGGAERFGFRLTQHAILSNHLHLTGEAGDRVALSRGMQGLLVRVARALNALWTRTGSVFADRFHARVLRTPREAHAALLYVLRHAQHHALRVIGIDLFTSGRWFDGWSRRIAAAREALPAALARTWLPRVGGGGTAPSGSTKRRASSVRLLRRDPPSQVLELRPAHFREFAGALARRQRGLQIVDDLRRTHLLIEQDHGPK